MTHQPMGRRTTGDPQVTGITGGASELEVPLRIFIYPTPVTSQFAQEMSRIATSHTTGAAGSVQGQNDIFNQLQLALAIKMGLNGPQLLKQRALQNVLTSNAARGDIQQILQARAELYGDSTNPKWFGRDVDLGAKAKSFTERNKARALLAGAPLMVAQIEALEMRRKMITGDTDVLRGMQLGTTATVGDVIKQLGKAPPLAILQLCNKDVGKFLKESMIRQLENLDFIQDMLSVGTHPELNPAKFTLLEGFNRHRNLGRFKFGHQSIDVDRLRFAHTASTNDHDRFAGNTGRTSTRSSTTRSTAVCQYYQRRIGCINTTGSRFVHKSIICGNRSHGAAECESRRANDRAPRAGARRRQRRNDDNDREASVPPDPRRRRGRADYAQ